MALNLFNNGHKLLGFRRKSRDEDATMRLFSVATPLLLVLLVVIITPRQFFASPINCWKIGTFTSNYMAYAERKCLVSGTYYVPEDEYVETYKSDKKLKWYPFTAVFIIMNTVAFIVPAIIWSAFNSQAGIEVCKVTEAARSYQKVDKAFDEDSNPKNKEEFLHYICENLNIIQKDKTTYSNIGQYSKAQNIKINRCCICFSRFNPSYLANLTLVVKILYILAVPFNFTLISFFIGPEFYTLGFKFFSRIGNGESVWFKEIFPLLTVCEFQVLSNMHMEPKKMQCLLTMNIFNEKIFLIIWFWYLMLFVVGIANLITWILFRYSSKYRYETFRPYLPVPNTKKEHCMMIKFVHVFLTPDCAFAMRLMSEHVDNLTMTILTTGLYNLYRQESEKVMLNADLNKSDSEISSENASHNIVVDDANLDNQMQDFANGL